MDVSQNVRIPNSLHAENGRIVKLNDRNRSIQNAQARALKETESGRMAVNRTGKTIANRGRHKFREKFKAYMQRQIEAKMRVLGSGLTHLVIYQNAKHPRQHCDMSTRTYK